MAYEIPQQLQHKEKIIFGLTFSQLGWAALFGTLVLVILTGNGSYTVRFTLALIPAVLGILFLFFNLSKWIKDISIFLKFRSASMPSQKLKQLIGIKKVEDDVIYSNNEVSVLRVKPINFSIKTKAEQETIIYGFQKFLNSLDFPVQFVVTTHNLNIDKYLARMKKRVNDKELFNDFSGFISKVISENEMKNRLFYLIIPKRADLDIQTKVCKERLESIGLQTERINDKQILNNLHLFFNDLCDKRKVEGQIKDNLLFLIGPNYIKDNADSLQINEKQCRIISAVGYPRSVESGFLDKIISSNDDFDISIHVEPYTLETMMVMLNKEIQKQRADLFAEELKKSINPSLEIKYKDTRKVLEEMQKGVEKLFNVSLYINCKGKTKEELDHLTKKVESELHSIMMVPRTPIFRQIQAYKSMIPVARDELGIKRNITTKALSAFFPFTSPFLTVEPDGVMLGLNKNRVPFIKDIFGLSNANGVILATSGSGKSYFTKLLISRQLLNNTKVMVIDPQNEYTGLVKHCKGELITISRHSKTIINPLDLMGHDYVEKRLSLMDVFTIMFGELTEIQKSILDKAISKTYAKKGIHADSYKNKKPPVLGDLYKTLIAMDKQASQMEKITYRALINRLYMYTEGVFGFMNRQSHINFKNNFVCFNIGDMPKQVKPVVMFLILDYVYMKMREDKERKLLVVDEAWSLLGKAEEAGYIFEIVKTCRKFNMGLLLITQDVADLVNSKAGHAVLANSSYSFLLRQKPSVIDSVVRTFNLSGMEKEYLLTATQGKGILILDNEHQELEVVASKKEHKLITTNPNEIMIEEKKVEDEREDITIDLDTNKGLYNGKELDLEQKNYLTNKGYQAAYFVPVGKKKQEEFWIKKNDLESLDHTFLVHNIKQELEKYTKHIEIAIVGKPDILFKNKKGQTIALEIETGKSFRKHKKRLETKFVEAKRQYKKGLVIVLTNPEYKRSYKRITTNIPILIRSDIPRLIQACFPIQKKT
ncbi:MAG: ATP-binding protein [Nanoarchaeota archaeon]|nr:ATP-binding protein [Nanoarchaeota archaeon]